MREDPDTCVKGRYWCGRYTVKNDLLYLVRNVSPESEIVRFEAGGTIVAAMERFHFLLPDDGLRLNGQYQYKGLGDDYPDYNGAIRFAADGRFAERNLLRAIAFEDVGLDENPQSVELKTAGSGTYAIGRNTLELRYTDGRVARILFYVPGDDRTPGGLDMIFVNNRGLTRMR
jgi:hypothetical protein